MCVHDVESFPRRHRLHRESAASGLVFSPPWCSGKCSLEPGKSCRNSKMRSKLQHGTHETTKDMNPRKKKWSDSCPKEVCPQKMAGIYTAMFPSIDMSFLGRELCLPRCWGFAARVSSFDLTVRCRSMA